MVLLSNAARKLSDLMDSIGLFIEYNPNPTYDGFYFTIPGLPKINIIVTENEKEFSSWVSATKVMQKIAPIEDRNERIKFFNDTRKGFL